MIVAFTGRMGSGKSTAAEHFLRQHPDFVLMRFAQGVKDLAARLGWNGVKDEEGRRLLQNIGEGARQILGEDVWVNALWHKWKAAGEPNLVVDDLRHPNEAAWVRMKGGLVVKIQRDIIDRSGPEHQHPSETGVDKISPDVLIINNGEMELFLLRVDGILGDAPIPA